MRATCIKPASPLAQNAFSPNQSGKLGKVAQILNDRLSDCIREYPDQYLWAHRRWRED